MRWKVKGGQSRFILIFYNLNQSVTMTMRQQRISIELCPRVLQQQLRTAEAHMSLKQLKPESTVFTSSILTPLLFNVALTMI